MILARAIMLSSCSVAARGLAVSPVQRDRQGLLDQPDLKVRRDRKVPRVQWVHPVSQVPRGQWVQRAQWVP
jgi:hypothetical protein